MLTEILHNWIAGRSPTVEDQMHLAALELSDQARSQAFGITTSTVQLSIQARTELFLHLYPAFTQLQTQLQVQDSLLRPLWKLWIPLAMHLANRRQTLGRPFVQGILGGQGTGKTTLAAMLTLILQQLGYRTLGWSLDDLYKTYQDRLQLQKADPRLIWRGPPGTHDVTLGVQCLDSLRQPNRIEPIALPRFDKSAWNGAGDRTLPEQVGAIDIVLFEGWFVGTRPIHPAIFETAPPPILTETDRSFARDMNTRLQDYLPLWDRLDALLVLYLPDYRLSQKWRRQAEHQMIATGRSGMSDAEIDAFVEYFWKALHPDLFIKPLVHNSTLTDLVIEINADHSPGNVYKPG